MAPTSLPRPLVLFGLSGILPQALCVIMALSGGESRWIGLAAGCLYAGLILSFLGGLWWMAALLANERASWPYLLAVLPSLAAWATFLPWCMGWRWPGPSLVILAVLLLASPLVDRALAHRYHVPDGWIGLRIRMATGLGLLTLVLAFA
ncbi:DUF3429 domain-containing protein [Rhizorhabdus phycosphaerae]|uniref:DUF3429 domain-containing protein n=1 Tax=Rhizorhabdus phycosphaerae TaxID=2711156 RepID=UPI0013ECD850|nr:DUF3429 domain-containing protein [Rhizorhabdus phycosphaerae]